MLFSKTLDSFPFHSASSPFWFTHMYSNDSSISYYGEIRVGGSQNKRGT
ncbi:hypothetical protein HanLR1_Chr08g0284651 [Helianthus annuus]|nr:hypothetical protein HanLR1_Chr08g0284651 [Helianthus annuus]